MGRHDLQDVVLRQRDGDVPRVAEPGRALGHSVEDRLDVRRRARDDLQDLRRRRLLLEGLAELAGPVLHLLLEGGIGLVELGGHPVELIGEPLKLVARLHVDALVEGALQIRAAPASSAWIGVVMRRASSRLASTESATPPRRSPMVRYADA